MRVILEAVEGPRSGRSFIFDHHDMFIVGRSRLVHCPIPEDQALSRDHFLIEISPPRCELRDLGSTNGTMVNGRKVAQASLKSGDQITAGSSTFAVKVEASPEPTKDGSWGGGRRASAGEMGGVKVRCAVCGCEAPPEIEIALGSSSDRGTTVHWLCDVCRTDIHEPGLQQVVTHYTMIRELGRGAMGVVYQARHNQTGRMVALKLIVPESAAARSAVDRFLREMSVISQLKHPNIVEWLEQGITRGQFWFAMEYVEGKNLDELVQQYQGQYPIQHACRMANQVLKGLEHAHSLGFVHRDIKPENILIGQGPKGLVAKISDFGLAKSYRSLGFSGLTFSGEMRGTIPYMPPEQVLDFKSVTPAGDLYSTTATLYYLLCGQFIYDDVEGADIIRMLLEEPPVPVQRRRPDVPTGLARVLERGLARDPANRYPSAAQLRQALKPYC
ncbi:MAG: protein kinase [Isosphaeraceae bacterium]